MGRRRRLAFLSPSLQTLRERAECFPKKALPSFSRPVFEPQLFPAVKAIDIADISVQARMAQSTFL